MFLCNDAMHANLFFAVYINFAIYLYIGTGCLEHVADIIVVYFMPKNSVYKISVR